MRRAFTLVELMVVVLVLAVLVAITLPVVSRMRSSARESANLTNLRTHAQAFLTYTGDFRGQFPLFTQAGPRRILLSGGGLWVPAVRYFDSREVWHVFMADAYYRVPSWSDVFFSPHDKNGANSGRPSYTTYSYPCVFIADPAYWDVYTRVGPSQFGPTRADQVLFPARKALIVDSYVGTDSKQDSISNNKPLSFALCDGSVIAINRASAREGYPHGDGGQFMLEGAVHFADNPPLVHTLNGVRGQDIDP